MSGRQELLHRTFLDLIFEPGGAEAFAEDPQGFGAAQGPGAQDQAALATYSRRLRVYRSLVKGSVLDPIPDCFPICKALLEAEDLWDPLLDDFFASRSVQSLYYRDVTPTFLAWLLEQPPHADRWPCLVQLAHYEYMELEILRWPDSPVPEGVVQDPAPERRVVFDGAFRNLAYGWRVHLADEEDPEPEPGSTCLVCLRDREGRFQCLEQEPAISAFLARCLEGAPIGEAARAFGLSLERALDLLRDLQARGGILGYGD